MCNGEQFCKKWKINLLEEEPWSSDHYNTKFTPIFIVSWVESGRAVRDGALVLQFYICLKIKFYPLPCQYHQHQHLATMMVNMPRLGAGAPGENHLSPTSSDSRHNRIGMAAFRFWLQVIESHSSQVQTPSRYSLSSVRHTSENSTISNTAESTKFVIMEISWINIQLLRIPSTSLELIQTSWGAQSPWKF